MSRFDEFAEEAVAKKLETSGMYKILMRWDTWSSHYSAIERFLNKTQANWATHAQVGDNPGALIYLTREEDVIAFKLTFPTLN